MIKAQSQPSGAKVRIRQCAIKEILERVDERFLLMPGGHHAAQVRVGWVLTDDCLIHDVVDTLTVRTPRTQIRTPRTKQVSAEFSKFSRGERRRIHRTQASERPTLAGRN